ncbi:MAG: AraC family transcriptional regulator [Aridibacter famidurans]|nr:AraC family transcriptional regulator [Aridibacter famidurans]
MGKVSSLFVRKVLSTVDDSVDSAGLLTSLGIDPDSDTNPKLMIPDTEYYTFLETLAGLESDPISIPLKAGESMRCDDYGAFGLAFKSASTLAGSYRRAERYARVLTSVSTYRLEMTPRGGFIHLHREGERRLGMRLSNEATIASIASISREVCAEKFSALEVHFKHAAPPSTAAHEDYFGCPVRFGSDRDALFVSREVLESPNRVADRGISRFFESHLENEISEMEEVRELEEEVRDHISDTLSEGVPSIGEVSKRFGMSDRTLQRRLSDRGHSFRELVDSARRMLAERLLRDSGFSLAEISFMTGFSDQSAFNRAFKRWAGRTPRSYRISSVSGSD